MPEFRGRHHTHLRRWLALLTAALVVIFLFIQLIPYGHQHPNPHVQAEPTWNSLQTRALAVRACFDCHSNQTDWRWYTNVAPVSWLTQNDVDGGRQKLNFSEWTTPQPWAGQAAQACRHGISCHYIQKRSSRQQSGRHSSMGSRRRSARRRHLRGTDEGLRDEWSPLPPTRRGPAL